MDRFQLAGDTNGKILFELISKIQGGRLWTGFNWLKTEVSLLCAR
jgi:hypothetical protein